MSRLMPGRVRNEGILLYEAGLVDLVEEEGNLYHFRVSDYLVFYDQDDRGTNCPCGLFLAKAYCEHVAAVEHYFKRELSHLTPRFAQKDTRDKRPEEQEFASRFLDALNAPTSPAQGYQLSAYGELNAYTNKLLWTLKIRRLPDQRDYVVRDISHLVRVIQTGDAYQIGKNYNEPLRSHQFDQASRELLTFLYRLLDSDSQLFFPNYGRHLFLPLAFFEEGQKLLGALSVFELSLPGLPTVTAPVFQDLTSQVEVYQFKVKLELSNIQLVIKEDFQLAFHQYAYVFQKGVFYRLSPDQQRLAQALSSLPLTASRERELSFSRDDQPRLAEQLLEFAQLGQVTAPKSFEVRDFRPSFFLDCQAGHLLLTSCLDYGDIRVDQVQDFDALPFTSSGRRLSLVTNLLNDLGFSGLFEAKRPIPVGEEAYHFLMKEIPRLEELGEVTLSEAVGDLVHLHRPKLHLSQQDGLLAVDFDFDGLEVADIAAALENLSQNRPYFLTPSGRVVIFDDEVRRISQTLLHLRAKQVSSQRYQLSSLASFQVRDALSDYDQVSFSQELEEMVGHLAKPETFPIGDLPVEASLRPYQLRGVQWLSVLDHYGFGGILADDMGLGKTLQTIAFLSQALSQGKKVLIVTPSSLVYNWQDEFSRFLPSADVCVVQGVKSQREEWILEHHQVSLTSYQSFRQDLQLYQSLHYDYLILDEAQYLKNSQTKIAQALRDFDVNRCFALSGTPIENRLLEIWSIFQIILPGLFVSKSQFKELSPKTVAKTIQPFVLRRRKEEVLPELPEVTERIYLNEMTKEQKAIYLAQLELMTQRLSGVTEAEFSRQKLEILSGITRLRQICDSPQLFLPYEGDSGKLESLRVLLSQLQENKHRLLIFSQFRGMLDLVQEELTQLGLSSYLLTGSTPTKERQEMTTAFNKGSRDAFLMSLKAGGVGLNLTGADTVILIDLWWNPAVEEQAIGRAHRLGQEKAVQVYRLITKGSIEEKMLTLQESKRHLIRDVLDGEDTRSSLTLEQMKQILGMD